MVRTFTQCGVAMALILGAFGAPVDAAPAATGTSTPSTTSTTSTTTTTTTTTVPAPTTTKPATTTTKPATTTTRPTTTTTAPPRTTTTKPPIATTVPCAPPTTTTTTTTLPGTTTTTSTTTTTIDPSTSTTTTTTTLPPPPCPTTTPATFPVPTAPPPPGPLPAPAPLGVDIPRDLGHILLTIRTLESGGRYDVPPNKGRASGAYQYIASTWNNHGGYPHAYLAPREVQDERALADVRAILWTWKGDVSMVPVIWYYPKAAADPTLMDQVPLPQFGNRLTVREYQRRWLEILAFITGDPSGFSLALAPPGIEFLSGIPPVVERDREALKGIAFPLLGAAVVAPPQPCGTDVCEDGSVAIVYGQKLQPVLAAVDGMVTAVQPHDPVSGAVTLTITDVGGRTFHYAGFNDDNPGTDDGAADETLRFSALAQVGTWVRAGQIVGYLGDTDPMPSSEALGAPDEAVWPHLRLTIRDTTGDRLDADLLVVSAQRNQACHVGIGPWSVPEDDRLDEPERERSDVDVDAILNGGWTLHDDGTVTAFGRSALILAPEGCEWAPDDAFGPGASGNVAPEDWDLDFEIATDLLVSAMLVAGDVTPVAPIRPG